MTISWLFNALGLTLIVANAALTVMWWRHYRRARALELLLGWICVEAFRHAHAPIWAAWAQVYRRDIQVQLTVAAREEEADEGDL